MGLRSAGDGGRGNRARRKRCSPRIGAAPSRRTGCRTSISGPEYSPASRSGRRSRGRPRYRSRSSSPRQARPPARRSSCHEGISSPIPGPHGVRPARARRPLDPVPRNDPTAPTTGSTSGSALGVHAVRAHGARRGRARACSRSSTAPHAADFMTITCGVHRMACSSSPGRACTSTAPRGRSSCAASRTRSSTAILRGYRELTGIPSLINTSFNVHEEPIVCTPAEAVKAFRQANLDALAMGEFLAINQSPDARHRRLATASAWRPSATETGRSTASGRSSSCPAPRLPRARPLRPRELAALSRVPEVVAPAAPGARASSGRGWPLTGSGGRSGCPPIEDPKIYAVAYFGYRLSGLPELEARAERDDRPARRSGRGRSRRHLVGLRLPVGDAGQRGEPARRVDARPRLLRAARTHPRDARRAHRHPRGPAARRARPLRDRAPVRQPAW